MGRNKNQYSSIFIIANYNVSFVEIRVGKRGYALQNWKMTILVLLKHKCGKFYEALLSIEPLFFYLTNQIIKLSSLGMDCTQSYAHL